MHVIRFEAGLPVVLTHPAFNAERAKRVCDTIREFHPDAKVFVRPSPDAPEQEIY